jgi:hypothetical protein
MDSTKQLLFDRYLFLGGIESSQRQFAGNNPEDIKNAESAEDVIQMTARAAIHSNISSNKYFDPSKPENWVVDFEAIVKGFL